MSEQKPIEERGYARPDALVSTQWVADHLDDPNVRIIESNEDPLVYPSGHIPGAVEIDWTRDLNDQIRRDYIDAAAFSKLLGDLGITADITAVLYGDNNNWWASYAFWVFQLFGHGNAVLMDGGRLKWEQEGRPLTRDIPQIEKREHPKVERNEQRVRVFRDQILEHVAGHRPLVDVRSPEEYSGERLHMPEYPNEGALRGGHIPGARNIPWARAVNEDGTFKSAYELREVYEAEQGLRSADDVICYCRIGERSSHTWFVLTYLLGYERVRNYDGSWTEWGNLVGVPIER
jgi:thiosulfate/3-mercaptopyruvate sulfurtransferase